MGAGIWTAPPNHIRYSVISHHTTDLRILYYFLLLVQTYVYICNKNSSL